MVVVAGVEFVVGCVSLFVVAVVDGATAACLDSSYFGRAVSVAGVVELDVLQELDFQFYVVAVVVGIVAFAFLEKENISKL